MTSYPASWNGAMPSKYLKKHGGLWIEIHTSAALSAAETACRKATGVQPTYEQPAGGYRSKATQTLMRLFPGRYNVAKVNGKYIAQAAVGKSTHGWGTAIDVANGLEWFIQHAHTFGFTRPNAVGDPRHFQHG